MGRAEGHAVDWRTACRAGGAAATRRVCKRRDRQLDGPNAPGWAASEERAATSVRRVGGEATLSGTRANERPHINHESSARSVASAVARFAGRGPFLTLRRCVGEREARDKEIMALVTLGTIAILASVIARNSRGRANVITLSCKGRLPRRPHCGTEAAATDLIFGAKEERLPCRRAIGAARRRLRRRAKARRPLSACEGSWAAIFKVCVFSILHPLDRAGESAQIF